MPSKLQHEIDKQIQEINTIIADNIIRDQEISTISTQIKNNLSIINNNYSHISSNKSLINSKLSKEGSEDLKIYRDGSNLQFSIDANAASNTKALNVYGGVVAQNYLTVGQTTLNTSYPFYVYGEGCFSSGIHTPQIYPMATNSPYIRLDISVTDAVDHNIALRIDANDIIVIKATGDGSGGITNKAIGLYGTTPTTQAAHIADATDLADCITRINAILVALENIGVTASS